MQPAFLLLDEPTLSLDVLWREEVLRAGDATLVPVLLVTHDERKAERIGVVIRMT